MASQGNPEAVQYLCPFWMVIYRFAVEGNPCHECICFVERGKLQPSCKMLGRDRPASFGKGRKIPFEVRNITGSLGGGI